MFGYLFDPLGLHLVIISLPVSPSFVHCEMTHKDIAAELGRVVRRHHLTYQQLKDVLKIVRADLGMKPSRSRRGAVARLTAEESDKFFTAAYRQGGTRGLMLTTLLETGCRVAEFCNLRIEDVSFEEQLVIIEHGKGDKRREVPIREELARMLRVHLANRETGYLFESVRNTKYSPRRIQQIVKEVATTAGITKNITPHKLRHSIATFLQNNGMRVNELKEFLGHEDIATTQIYAKTDAAAVRRGFDAAMGNR